MQVTAAPLSLIATCGTCSALNLGHADVQIGKQNTDGQLNTLLY